MLDVTKVPSPCYVMEEDLLRKNLSLIKVWQNVPVWKLFLLSRLLPCGNRFRYSVNIFITQQQVLNTKPDWLSKSLAARLIRILLLITETNFSAFSESIAVILRSIRCRSSSVFIRRQRLIRNMYLVVFV